MRNLKVEEIECKSILNKSVMDFSDYTLNAYQGCAFACSYCYVPAMRMRRGQVDELPWGGWIQVKVNAADVLRRQMLRIDPEASIAIGTATDSWQPIEKKYGIARDILVELSYYPNPVSILTRSPLLVRDIDILQRIENARIGVSLPTFDDRIRRAFEPFAPSVTSRLHLIRKLIDAGLPPSLAAAPILPGVTDHAEAIRGYLKDAAQLGVRRVWFGMFHHGDYLTTPHMRLVRAFRESGEAPTQHSLPKAALKNEVERWSRHYGISATI